MSIARPPDEPDETRSTGAGSIAVQSTSDRSAAARSDGPGSDVTGPGVASPTTTGPSTTALLTRTRVGERIRRRFKTVTTAGWITMVLTVASWIGGWWLGWEELMVIAGSGVVALLLALVFVLGSAKLEVEVDLQPPRVVVGERAAGTMLVTNASPRRLLPFTMELLVGEGAAEFELPSLRKGETHESVYLLPTHRRAVIPVGPATSVRGDPLGLLRRSVAWTEPLPLIVHPRTVPLDHLGAGFLRDLEGQTTPDISNADIAFHAMREYEPGDDRRFVHWLTTARVGKLMVRQFTDTRRAHLGVLVDGSPRAYAVEDEFELAISVAGSLGLRAVLDEQQLTMVAADRHLLCATGQSMLDGLAAVELPRRHRSLAVAVDRLNRVASGMSLAMVITGSRTPLADLRGVSLRFDPDVRTVLVRIDPGEVTEFRPVGSTLVLTVANLDELAHLLRMVTRS